MIELPAGDNETSVYSHSGWQAISVDTTAPKIINTQVITRPNFCIQEIYARNDTSSNIALINVQRIGQDIASSVPGSAVKNAEIVIIHEVAKTAANKNQNARTR